MRSVYPYDEAALLTLLKSGNHKAFDELYLRFAPSLLRSMMRLIPDRQQAEDLLQDSFVKIWLNLHQYDSAKGRLYTWMLRITRNIAFTHLRLSRVTDQHLDDLPHEVLGSVTPSYHAIGLSYWVNSTLGPNHRQLIDLVYFQGYTHQEVSTEFGFPLGTVKTGLRQALQHLRKSETTADLCV